ncbi:LysR family transcriptional regulator [Kineococcus rhizosphaerae]|uniref:DNA-binding transcriptional LysR family regulator n=1 Tax=Kineococcus rhizosphaerae TaxID=559628 RepID=A0A2T0QZE9_9ACTN|nr:LysR family transcriptional regulator [Kineococcus rhizosphaerae]PRY12069.1 DNA-binding transcriptional LysR family regulator [Kineococcus rhizosphaerae]
MLDVHRLRLLRELHRRGTLAAVAAALSYSPSAVSQQLSQLEAEAGVPLLEKLGRGVVLTPAARLLVEHADVVLAQLEQAEADLAALAGEAVGTLRVASFQTVLFALVPDALTALAAAHPALRVVIDHREVEPAFSALAARDVDLVLGEEYPDAPHPRSASVHEEDLVHDELRVAVPLTGPWAGARALEDLAGAPWVLEPVGTDPGRWALARCRRAGFEPDVRVQTPDALLHVHLVETGHAVALLPDLSHAGRAPRVRVIDLPEHPARRLFTGVRRGAADRPAVRAFRSALRQVAQEVSRPRA